MKLNLGCGKDIKPGWVNCDLYPVNTDVVKIDLNKLPLPFDNNSADEILMSHVLEHVNNRYAIIVDCYRILKSGGILNIKLPIAGNSVSHESYYHQKNYLRALYSHPKTSFIYADVQFDLVSVRKRVYPCRARVMERYYRLLSWLDSLVFFEYSWRLRKV